MNDPKIIKQLFGYQRVHLNPGQSVNVKFVLEETTLETGDEKGIIRVNSGLHRITITNGSVDQVLKNEILLL